MRDLGVMRTRKEHAQVQARFSNKASAQSAFALQEYYQACKSTVYPNAQSVVQAIDGIPIVTGERAEHIHNKILLHLASIQLDYDAQAALDLLASIDTSPAQEKWVREAYKRGDKEAVENHLCKLIDDPLSDDLAAFAEDFLLRKFHKKRTSILTDMLRDNSQQCFLDEIHKGRVERAVVERYQTLGKIALRTENEYWRALFGLFFWPDIFETPGLGLLSEFDAMPSCLRTNKFYSLAAKAIEARIALVSNASSPQQALLKVLSKHAAMHYGKHNAIFRWRSNLLEQLDVLIKHVPTANICDHLRCMTQDWKGLSDGYPDIMVLENEQVRFEEIKAEGDQLRRNQLTTILKLKEQGFDVRITQVHWQVDPMQPYVVIDIETTGGRAQSHKITEIGAVKVINGEIVARWQSLINPQKRIPANITALTGISQAMVADAPLFSDIAQELDDFTQGCVFVAHNVNFDYGFIREEFARIDRNFKRPKLCTVMQMRKHFKGLSSYSLANLTKHFGISMQQHHRAMSDALAAAELLNMVNEKRLAPINEAAPK